VRSTNIAPAFSLAEKLSSMSCVSRVVYSRPPVSKACLLLWEQWVDDCFDMNIDESFVDFKGDTQQRYGMIALWVPQWLLWLRDCNY